MNLRLIHTLKFAVWSLQLPSSSTRSIHHLREAIEDEPPFLEEGEDPNTHLNILQALRENQIPFKHTVHPSGFFCK